MELLSNLRFAFTWALAGGLVAAGIAILMPNYYLSEARILPVDSKASSSSFGGLASAAAALGVSLPGNDGGDANFIDILNSRWLREQLVATEFQFHERSWRFGPEKAEKQTLSVYFKAKNVDAAVRALGRVLAASRDVKTKIITVRAETKSPELSQQIVCNALRLLEQFNQLKGHTRGGAKAAFAEARLIEARRELDEAEMTFRGFLETNRGYQASPDPDTRLKGVRLETEYRLRQQLLNSIALNREQALMEEKNDIPILNILDAANLPLEKSRPKRANMVELAMVFCGVVAWAWGNRKWIVRKILANYEPSAVDP